MKGFTLKFLLSKKMDIQGGSAVKTKSCGCAGCAEKKACPNKQKDKK